MRDVSSFINVSILIRKKKKKKKGIRRLKNTIDFRNGSFVRSSSSPDILQSTRRKLENRRPTTFGVQIDLPSRRPNYSIAIPRSTCKGRDATIPSICRRKRKRKRISISKRRQKSNSESILHDTRTNKDYLLSRAIVIFG